MQPHQEGSPRAGRLVVDLPARCLVEGGAYPLPGNVLDLGAGGLRLRLPELLPVGTGVTVTIRSPLQALTLPGRIAWAEARPGERPAHGVAFTDPGAGREALHQVFLAEFLLRVGRPEPAPPPRYRTASRPALSVSPLPNNGTLRGTAVGGEPPGGTTGAGERPNLPPGPGVEDRGARPAWHGECFILGREGAPWGTQGFRR